MTEYTDDQILVAISAALKAKDMDAVGDLIILLALQNPNTAKQILDGMRMGYEMRGNR